MDPLTKMYHEQKKNADLLRQRLRFPIAHGHNLPPKVDLRRWMTAIEDQGEMESCVANSIARSLEYLYRRYTGKTIDVSRLFIDFNARLDNLNWAAQRNFVINIADPGDSFGTDRKAAIRVLQQHGFCLESSWPYDKKLFMRIPPKEVYDEAARHSIVPLRVPINIGDNGYCYVPYEYLIDKRLVSTGNAFWTIAQIIPRKIMRPEYISYPNFTQYHQQYMLSLADKHNRKHQHRRRRSPINNRSVMKNEKNILF